MAEVKTPITELDFDGIKTQLKTYLQTQTQFKDYNFEGSNLSALLDVLAYNTFMNNFYTNMAINEMFLDTASLKNSLVSHAKELNYLPRSRKSARAEVIVTITKEDEIAQTITIPEYSVFNATYLGDSFAFVTDEAYIAKRNSCWCLSDRCDHDLRRPDARELPEGRLHRRCRWCSQGSTF